MIKTGILTALYLVFTLMILGCAAQNETVTEPNAAVTQCISSVILSACVLIAYKLM
ncbi:Hypothetical predicted protein [Mytilus galloprovincialis]|uniref:Lipoprotein n=1 Tax=Mytilus galloprovincialis TaxID=29158 RepID=A0A8B6GJK5_MYTGA|nr:Hypothetical predicted protein [Mytilus galloprovincialis]